MLHRHHFTVEEANEVLPVVRVTIRRLQQAKQVLVAEGLDTGLAALAEVTGGAWPGRTRARAAVDAALGFAQLEALDVVIRDLEQGLIDFPALRHGREVYLCWHVEEPAVGHWHHAETGYGGRLPIDPSH